LSERGSRARPRERVATPEFASLFLAPGPLTRGAACGRQATPLLAGRPAWGEAAGLSTSIERAVVAHFLCPRAKRSYERETSPPLGVLSHLTFSSSVASTVSSSTRAGLAAKEGLVLEVKWRACVVDRAGAGAPGRSNGWVTAAPTEAAVLLEEGGAQAAGQPRPPLAVSPVSDRGRHRQGTRRREAMLLFVEGWEKLSGV